MKDRIKNIKSCKYNNICIYTVISIILMAISFYSIIWYDKFTVNDTIMHYLWARENDYVGSSWAAGVGQGRIMYILYNFLSVFVYAIDNNVIYNIISFMCVSFSAFAMCFFLYRNVNCYAAYLGAILFWAFAQADWQHNFFVSYIGPLQLPIGFAILSLEQQFQYYRSKNRRNLIFSALFLVLASSFYEVFILFSILNAVICLLYNNYNKNGSMKNCLFQLRYHIGFMFIYLSVYFAFRIAYPSQYDGNKPELVNFIDCIKVIWTYAWGMFPGKQFMKYINYEKAIEYFDGTDLIKSILVGLLCTNLLYNCKKINKKKVLLISILSFCSILLCCSLYGVTEKHVQWVELGVFSYGASYYSYFFIVIFLCSGAIILYQLIKFKKILLILFCCGISVLTCATNISNKYCGDILSKQYFRFKTLEKVLQSDAFQSYDNGSYVMIPTNYHATNADTMQISLMDSLYSNKHMVYVSSMDDIPAENRNRVVLLEHVNENAWILSEINENYDTNKVFVFTLQGIRNPSLIAQGVGKIENNGRSMGLYNGIVIFPLLSENDRQYYEITGELNVSNINIVDQILEKSEAYNVKYQDGTYGLEYANGNEWVWNKNESNICITNYSTDAFDGEISFDVLGGCGESDLIITIGNQKYEYLIKDQETINICIPIELQHGDTIIEFDCNGEALTSSDDSRNKVFALYNFQLLDAA